MEFLYLPSTERNYNVVMTDDNFIKPSISTTSSVSVITSTSTKLATATPSYTTQAEKVEPSNKISKVLPKLENSSKCLPMSVDFCFNINNSSFQNPLDEKLISQLRAVVDSQCYPYSAHFLCSSSIACNEEDHRRANASESSLPCQDYCEEFLTNCGQQLPAEFKAKLKCGPQWKGVNSCVTKPGCVTDLYNSGQGHRICDGLMGKYIETIAVNFHQTQ